MCGRSFPRSPLICAGFLRQEYAALSLHDEKTGQLVRQAIDFPLGTGPGFEISAPHDPRSRALQQRTPLIFSKDEMKALDSKVYQTLFDRRAAVVMFASR